MHRLYIQKNPPLQAAETPTQRASGTKVIVVILFFLFVVWPAFGLLASMLR